MTTRLLGIPLRLLLLSLAPVVVIADSARADDPRILVEMPQMMQQHMLRNMRDHLASIDEIMAHLVRDEMDRAAEVAEQRLGMSSLDDHGASHMAALMPEEMRGLGTTMHRAASRFALRAQEGELLPALSALREVTAACVACHAAYRVH